MNLVYSGKTKDVYSTENPNEFLLKFKDDVTGTDGVFDPGANTVGLTVDGAGKSGLKMTTYFFELMNNSNVKTHFVSSDIENSTMIVKKAEMFGKGLEVICRFKAVGSFFRRYGDYCKEGQELNSFVEVTLKDDAKGDPVISKDALTQLGIMSENDFTQVKEATIKICNIVKNELATKRLELYDIKLEFGKDIEGDIMLIDEISGGNMRVYKDGKYIEPLVLEKEFLGN